MKKIVLLFFLAGLTLSSGLQAQELVQKVEAEPGKLVIPFEKYVLDNGLTVILHEDHSDPIVHVDVTFHVGSAREELNKSGFAHFFEHMLFQGSENVADEEHFKIITESGGTLNGSTNTDRTNYYETVPNNQLETVLWLEADRMGYFLDAVTQKKFEVQRATVKNEKQQNYDNRPYGLRFELQARTLYPYGHPYSWLTIGILEDLDRVELEDLKKFFLRWYGPNNAALTIAGDFDKEQTLEWVNKYFGKIPAGPDVESMELDPVTLDKDRYVHYEDPNIRFPALSITYPTVPRHHPDEPALDCLAEILGQGQGSYFYKKFVKNQQAIQAFASHPARELAGQFDMLVLPFPGKSLAEFEQQIRDALEEFEQEGVSDEDVQKFLANAEASTIRGLQSVAGKSRQLAQYWYMTGDPNYLPQEVEAYGSLTKEKVIEVYNKYIKGKPAVIMSIVPPGADSLIAAPDNFTPQTEGENPYPTTDYSQVADRRSPPDDFDRSVRPKSGPNPVVKVPELWQARLENEVPVAGTEYTELPLTTIQITIDGGHMAEMEMQDKAGLASLTASLMNEGTENYSAEEFSKALDMLGSNISVSSGNTSTTIYVSALTKNLDATLDLLEERMFRSVITQEDFDRAKKQQIEGIQAAMKQPASIANNVYSQLIYGKNSFLAVPTSGTMETVENISLEDVEAFRQGAYGAQLARMVVISDLPQDEILPSFDFLNEWEATEAEFPEVKPNFEKQKSRIYLVDKTKAPQSEIRIGYANDLTYDPTGEYYDVYLMNYPLGGAFNSRINLNLREDKGWTYGARSYFQANEFYGSYTARAGIKAVASDSAVYEFMKEITDYYEDGITEEELAFMKSSIGQRDARNYETPRQKAGFINDILRYDLSPDFPKEQARILNEMSLEKVNRIAKKYLNPDEMAMLVVGDKESLLPKLERLGYEIIVLDVEGKLVPTEKSRP